MKLKVQDLRDKLNYNRRFVAPKLMAVGYDKLAKTIEQCSEVSCMATCKNCGTRYYVGSTYCKSRYCAICAKLRAMAWLVKLVPLLQQYQSEGYKIFMLNLTIKDNDSLEYILERLMRAWRIMIHDDKYCAKEFKRLNDGGVRSVEVKIGENSGLWHPHIHSIVLLKTDEIVYQYNSYRKIWEHATGIACGTTEKVGSIDIRGIKGYDGDIVGAVLETFKYITKFDWLNIPNERIAEMLRTVSGRHMISSWGVLYRINQQLEELLNKSSEDEIKEQACKVCGCTEFELQNMLTIMLPKEISEF